VKPDNFLEEEYWAEMGGESVSLRTVSAEVTIFFMYVILPVPFL
jgi:hypothetical protein